MQIEKAPLGGLILGAVIYFFFLTETFFTAFGFWAILVAIFGVTFVLAAPLCAACQAFRPAGNVPIVYRLLY